MSFWVLDVSGSPIKGACQPIDAGYREAGKTGKREADRQGILRNREVGKKGNRKARSSPWM